MLHNMLLQYDGLDAFSSWEEERDHWENLHPQSQGHDEAFDEIGVPLQEGMFRELESS